jgi:hypothetical protein
MAWGPSDERAIAVNRRAMSSRSLVPGDRLEATFALLADAPQRSEQAPGMIGRSRYR